MKSMISSFCCGEYMYCGGDVSQKMSDDSFTRFSARRKERIDMSSSTIAIIITLLAIVSFVLERIPLAMTALIASLAMGILLPEMSLGDIYSGFSSTKIGRAHV